MSSRMRFWLLAAITVAAWITLAIAVAAPALAHDSWINGKMVDPQTKIMCCGQNDCKLVAVERTHARDGGYYLDDTAEFIPSDRVQPSPDGAFWACRWGGSTKCFFAPVQGS